MKGGSSETDDLDCNLPCAVGGFEAECEGLVPGPDRAAGWEALGVGALSDLALGCSGVVVEGLLGIAGPPKPSPVSLGDSCKGESFRRTCSSSSSWLT